MKKKIRIEQLQPGMFVASTNRNWLHLPFFRRKIRSGQTIDKLKNAGVTEVVIDLTKGIDIDSDGSSQTADPFDHPDILVENLEKSARVHEAVLNGTKDLMEQVRAGEEISASQADVQVNQLMDRILEDPQSMLCVSVLKNADEYTYAHCVNTSILALFVGKTMGLPTRSLLILGKGAMLHDIGKCMIPNEILIKPGKLDKGEEELIRDHVALGMRYAGKVKGMEREVLDMVQHHHERLDGSGYPAGLKGDQISWQGRICAVLDVYDALIHENYYKSSIDPTEVLKVLAGSVGTQFDEKAFKALADCIGIYPPGTILMLDSGEIALVFKPNPHNPYRPKVLLLTRVDGSFHTKPAPANLTETVADSQKYKRSILTTLSLEDTNFNPFEIMSNFSLTVDGHPPS